MSATDNAGALSQQVFEELQTAASRVGGIVCAKRLWDRHLTLAEQVRLGSDVQAAYAELGTLGMWKQLRGVTHDRAVVEVAQKLGFLRTEDAHWLLGEIGETLDAEEAMENAIARGDLELVAWPRAAHWDGEEINISWCTHTASWEFF